MSYMHRIRRVLWLLCFAGLIIASRSSTSDLKIPVYRNHKSLSFFDDLIKLNNKSPGSTFCIDLPKYNYFVDQRGIDYDPKVVSSSLNINAANRESTRKSGKSYLYPLLETIRDASLRGYIFIVTPGTNKTKGCFKAKGALSVANIPRVIHQSWKSRNLPNPRRRPSAPSIASTSMSNLPDYYSVRLNTPEFLYVLWTDSDIDAFIRYYYPQYGSYIESLDLHIKRMDFIRYLIMLQYGGVYVDTDVAFKQSILPLIESKNPMASLSNPNNSIQNNSPFLNKKPSEIESIGSSTSPRLEFVSFNPNYNRDYNSSSIHITESSNAYLKRAEYVGNAFFASVPDSAILKNMVDYVISFKHPIAKSKLDVLKHTGPLGLAYVVKRYIETKAAADLTKHASQEDIYNYFKTQPFVRVLNYKLVGNEVDNPLFAVHYRLHRWGKDGIHLA